MVAVEVERRQQGRKNGLGYTKTPRFNPKTGDHVVYWREAFAVALLSALYRHHK